MQRGLFVVLDVSKFVKLFPLLRAASKAILRCIKNMFKNLDSLVILSDKDIHTSTYFSMYLL